MRKARISLLAGLFLIAAGGSASAKDDTAVTTLQVEGLPPVQTQPWADKHGRDKDPKVKKKDLPLLVALPTVSGTAREREQLGGAAGTWLSQSATTYAWRWLRCDASGLQCQLVPGAEALTLRLGDADIGWRLRRVALATNENGTSAAASEPTPAIVAAPPHLASAPVVTGEAREGQTLSTTLGFWDGLVESFDVTWLRCDAAGEACVPRSADSALTLGLDETDVDHTLRAQVTARGPGGETTAVSAATSRVLPLPPQLVAAAGIVGEPIEGTVLTASLGEWTGRISSVELAWLRCAAAGEPCVETGVLNTQSYALTEEDVGFSLRVYATAFGPGGSTNALSAPTGVVVFAPPANLTAPLLSGVALEGEGLSTSEGTWAGRIFGLRYRWLACDLGGGSCTPVEGAHGATLALPYTLVGRTMRAEVTASGPGGETTSLSAPSTAVLAAPPTFDAAPSISGLLVVDNVLRGTVGPVRGQPTPTLAYQWQRCDVAGTCADVMGATQSLLRLTSADVGQRLRLVVTATGPGGSTVASSGLTAPVEAGGAAYAATVQGHGPLAYWRLAETSGTVVRDATANGVQGSYMGGVALGQPGAMPADANTSIGLNGTTGRVAFGDVFDFSGKAAFTLEAWVRPDVIDTWHRRIFNKEEKDGLGRWQGYRMAVNSSSLGLYCQRWSDGANTQVYLSPAQLTLGRWYHVACTYDGATLRLYVNGSQVMAKASSLVVAATSAPLTVGSFTNGGSASFWSGGLDEVAVYGRALSAAEVASHLNASRGSAPSLAGSPVVSGLAQVGQVLSAGEGTWTGTGPVSFSFEWERCDAAGTCASIPGATSETYPVGAADVGGAVRVTVTASNAFGTARANSAPTAVVEAGSDFELCMEAEDAARWGEVLAASAAPETVRGTVVPSASVGGGLRLPFALSEATHLTAWVRVRTPALGHAALHVALSPESPSEATRWEAPVSPVLRWQKVRRAAAQDGWPGWMPAGNHVLELSGADEGVEVDAVCLRADGREPQERFPEAPERPVAHSVRDFGAVGDGVTDDTAALRAALAALSPGEALLVPAGRYRFTDKLELRTREVSVVGEGPGSVLFADLPAGSTHHAFQVLGGYEGAAFPLAEDAQFLDRTLVVPASAGFASGDRLLLSSDEWGDPAPNLTTLFHRNRQNLLRVTAVLVQGEVAYLSLDRPVLGPFLREHNARVQRYNGVKGVVVANLRVEGPARPVVTDNPDNNLLFALRCDRCFFVDLQLAHARKAALEVGRSMDTHVARVLVEDATDVGGGGHGYGVSFSYTQGSVVRDSLFRGVMRHSITISWGSRENVVFANSFDRGAPHAEQYASVDIHGQDDYGNLVERNWLSGGEEGLMVGGGGTSHGNDGPWNVLRGNRVENVDDGISVFKKTFDTIIEDNVVVGTRAYGMRIESGSDRAHVRGNRVMSWAGVGIAVRDSNGAELRGNVLQRGNGTGVRIDGTSSGYVVEGNLLNGASLVEPGTGMVSNP